MTYDELLAEIDKELEISHWEAWHEGARALRAIVELTAKPLPLENLPIEQVLWFHEGYNLALDNILDIIEKELS